MPKGLQSGYPCLLQTAQEKGQRYPPAAIHHILSRRKWLEINIVLELANSALQRQLYSCILWSRICGHNLLWHPWWGGRILSKWL